MKERQAHAHANSAPAPEVLAFDVFGTVVDWHHTIVREIQALAPGIDGAAFANAWRAGYQPAMARVRSGDLPWTRIDELHRMILDAVLPEFGLDHLDEAARANLNRVWHRLDPWPDSPRGLTRLRSRFVICTLSNGNLGLLTRMARHAGLPWDLILSAEVFRHYKPDPQTYLGVAETFDIPPQRVMMVAAHKDDLRAAAACGLRTAFIERPLEYGAAHPVDVRPEPEFDHHATDLVDLAAQLDC